MNRDWMWPTATVAAIATLWLLACLPLPTTWWLFPWLLSLVFIGLPHGGLDHEVILRLWKPQPPPRWALVASIAGYLTLSLGVIGLWLLAPLAVFSGFILLTLLHWGLGDLWWSWNRDASYFTSRFHRIMFAVERGSFPMLLPMVTAPQIYRHVAEAICRLFAESKVALGWMDAPIFRGEVFAVVTVFAVWEFFLSNRKSSSRFLNLFEGVALMIAFLVLPPLVSIGFYFVLWHGLRHVLRLMKSEQISYATFVRRSALTTLAALVFLIALACFILHAHRRLEFLALYLVLIASLTVPHSAVVTWMDRQERLY